MQITNIFKSNPEAFSRGDLSPEKIAYLEQLLAVEESVEIEGQVQVKRRDGKAELDWVIQNKSFQGIVNFKIYRNKENLPENKYVKFLQERDLTPLQIANLFKSNPVAFSSGDLSTEKIAYLEQLLAVEESMEIEGQVQVKRRDGKAELDWVIQNKTFAGIVNFKIYKNKEALPENKYVKFLQERGLTPLQIADIFKSDPSAFSRGDLSTEKITYLEQLLEVEESVEIEGQVQVKRRDGKAELDWVIQNRSFAGIVNFKIYKNKEGLFENKYVKFLQGRGLAPLQIADIFKSNPVAFSRGDLFDKKITYLEQLLEVEESVEIEDQVQVKRRDGKAELDWVMQNGGFAGVVDFKVYKNKEGLFENKYVKFLQERGLTPLQIADIFKSNPLAFSMGDLDLFDKKITYLEQLLAVEESVEIEDQKQVKRRDGKTELNWVIRNRSFQGIVNFKIYKNKENLPENKYVKFLQERGLTPLQIANIFTSDSRAFSMGNLSDDKITYLERYLGKDDRNKGKKKLDQIILKKGGFRALVLFDYNSHAQIKNRVINVLENGMHFSQDQVIEIMENHFSELFVEELTEMTSKEYIEKLMKKVPEVCQKSLS